MNFKGILRFVGIVFLFKVSTKHPAGNGIPEIKAIEPYCSYTLRLYIIEI
jgi:hypothetical protein